MSRCSDFSEVMWFVETGELPDGRHTPLSCLSCKRQMDDYVRIRSALRGLGEVAGVRPSELELDRKESSSPHNTHEWAPTQDWFHNIQHSAPEAAEVLALARQARKFFLSNWAEATRLATEAVARSASLLEPKEPAGRALTRVARAEAVTALGICDTFNDRLEQGHLGLVRSLQLWEEIGDPLGIGNTRHNLAIACMKRKVLPEAEFHARQAVTELLLIGQTPDAAKARNTLAIILGYQGRKAASKKEFREAMLSFRLLKMHAEWAMAAVSLARTQLVQDDQDTAIQLTTEAEPILIEQGYLMEAARCAWLRGSLQLGRQGELAIGLETLATARDSLLSHGMWLEPAVILCEAAVALLNAGRRAEALAMMEQVQGIVPADQANQWVLDALSELRGEFEHASNPRLINVFQGLAAQLQRLDAPAPPMDNSTIN